MAKKDESEGNELDNLFIGGEDDDLAGMEYIQDENSTMKVQTQPPETIEDAKLLADMEEPAAEEVEEVAEAEAEEVEAEAEAEVEEVAEAEAEVAKIPKERFDEVNERMKIAERERDELKERLNSVVEEKREEPEPEPFDYKAKEQEAMDAMLEGDAEKYSAINQEIRQAEKDEYVREAEKIANQGDLQVQEAATFDEVGAKIERDFPQFVEDGDSYNAKAREELMDLYVGYAKSGLYTRAQALQRAADKAAKIHDLIRPDDNSGTEETADNVVNIKKSNPKQKAAVSNSQPPSMESRAAGTGDEPRVDIMSMSDEEFDSLPESTKRRARGDLL
jgi:hypothetical protein